VNQFLRADLNPLNLRENLDVDQLDRKDSTCEDFIQDWLGAFRFGLARTPLGGRWIETCCLRSEANLVPEL
jgi:hypothetical protein